jgi:hypothetical protein
VALMMILITVLIAARSLGLATLKM